jgi:superoxide oxidase
MAAFPASAYSLSASWLHWITAVPALGCIGTVLTAQQAPKEEKGKWMHRHKSLGLLTAMIVAPRIAYRVLSSGNAYYVRELPGNAKWETAAGKLGHYFLYAFLTIMPASGIAMGLYGGKGLPFFWTTLDGFEKVNGNIAKQAFFVHKNLGTYGKFAVPVHAGAAVLHTARGQSIFARINPFRTPRG